MKKLIWYWLPPVLYMAFIFFLSSQSSFPVEVPIWFICADKAAHTGLYTLLGLLVSRALIQGNPVRFTKGMFILTVVITSLYGVSDEFHQSFVPGRTPDVFDWMTDTLGALLACAFYYWRKIRLQKQLA